MPSTPSPLRNDLVVIPQDTASGTVYVVKDPVNRRFFRFKEVEHHIAQLLDGARTDDQIRRDVETKFDAPLEQKTFDAFIAQLEEHGLLDKGGPVVEKERPIWNAKNPYSVRMHLFDPDRLLDRMIVPLRFMFTPVFVVAAALIIAWAAVSTFLDWGAITANFKSIGLLSAVLLAWPTVILVGVLHEFAHGLTCKYFGGEVRDMGFLLMYYHPALYCNVSDTWLFPEKWKRLCVMFAGTFLELLLWALATITWRFTEVGTLPNALALVVVATSGAKIFLNFNPLIKLDGYYILSDLLDIPNLRKKSFLYVRRRIGLAPKEDEGPVTARERRAFLTYGIIATLFSLGLLVFVSTKVAGFLMGRYQAWGLAAFLVVAPFLFRYRLRRLLPGSPLPSAPKSGLKLLGSPAHVLGIGGIAAAVLLLGTMNLKVTGDFAVLPVHNSDVRSEVDGIVSDVLVDEGDEVKKGQMLARLSSREFGADLEKTGADLEEATARYNLLSAGTRPEQIELARKELETARARRDHAQVQIDSKSKVRSDEIEKAKSALALSQERLTYAKNNVDRSKKLMDQGVLSAKDYESVAEQLAVRQREVDDAAADLKMLDDDDLVSERREAALADGGLRESEQRLRVLQAGTRPEELEATRAQVERLESERRYLEDQVRLTTITSPIDGVVTTPERQLREMPGQYVKKGDLITEVHDVSAVTVEINVSEKEIEDVKVGQKVTLKARAYPDRIFTGKVTSIASTAHGAVANNSSRETEQQRDLGTQARDVIVRTRIPNPGFMLKPDMTGKAKISCGHRSLFSLMTRRLARAIRVEFWSWW